MQWVPSEDGYNLANMNYLLDSETITYDSKGQVTQDVDHVNGGGDSTCNDS